MNYYKIIIQRLNTEIAIEFFFDLLTSTKNLQMYS